MTETTESVVNREAILELVDNDWDFLAELVEMLEVDSKELTVSIAAALQGGQADQVARDAHALTGILGNLTVGPCYRYAEALEKAGKSGDLARAQDLFGNLSSELAGLIPALQSFVAEGSAS